MPHVTRGVPAGLDVAATLDASEPVQWFDDSRRLTGPNLFFDSTGAVLDTAGPAAHHAASHAVWESLVRSMCAALQAARGGMVEPHEQLQRQGDAGWGQVQCRIRLHAAGASLAFTAPADQLFTATDINEWAWHSATAKHFPQAFFAPGVSSLPSIAAVPLPALPAAFDAALLNLLQRSRAEHNRRLRALLAMAQANGVSALLDDDELSLGTGPGSRTWPLMQLPEPSDVPWPQLSDVVAALVTGSNGKTTTVRLLCAMARAFGRVPGANSTTGVTIGSEILAEGDYAGPAGARLVLRDTRVQLAVLETARGGVLRRGLALAQARVAVVTNVSDDHFGEWGIDNLQHLTEAKLVVAHAVRASGVLVLNADCAPLMQVAQALPHVQAITPARRALFAADANHVDLVQLRAQGGTTCGVQMRATASPSSAGFVAAEGLQGHLLLHAGDMLHDLGLVHAMPLAAGGAAAYNIANMAAAALAAWHLGIAPVSIAAVLARFGHDRQDNPGRLERWQVRGAHILVDYAHNPAGLQGLLAVATSLRGAGRLGLLLGQAGNRDDHALDELARVAAASVPDRVVIKEIAAMLRGRGEGEVPALLHGALRVCGVPPQRMDIVLTELEAAQALLRWAQPGDVVVLPIHQTQTLSQLRNMLDNLSSTPPAKETTP